MREPHRGIPATAARAETVRPRKRDGRASPEDTIQAYAVCSGDTVAVARELAGREAG